MIPVVRSTPALVAVFLVVFHRWLEMVSGWPDGLLLALTAVAGTLLVDRLILPPSFRLNARAWVVNVAIAAAIGALVTMVAA
jgi:hypothetical protein